VWRETSLCRKRKNELHYERIRKEKAFERETSQELPFGQATHLPSWFLKNFLQQAPQPGESGE